MGQDGVAATLDPAFIENVRLMDELEGRVAPRDEELALQLEDGQADEAEEQADGEPSAKRLRLEAPEEEPVAKRVEPAVVPVQEETKGGGLLGLSTLSNLRVLAEMSKAAGPVKQAPPPSPPAKSGGGLAGLADYGSDSEED